MGLEREPVAVVPPGRGWLTSWRRARTPASLGAETSNGRRSHDAYGRGALRGGEFVRAFAAYLIAHKEPVTTPTVPSSRIGQAV